MGARFALQHANFVAYLTTDQQTSRAPRASSRNLSEFLMSLAYPYPGGTLISSTMGTADDWTRQIADAAKRESDVLGFQNKEKLLTSTEVSRRLDPLRTYFTGYDPYAMRMPST